MLTVIELPATHDAVVAHVAKLLEPYKDWPHAPAVERSTVRYVEYMPDMRIGWRPQTLVILKDYGVVGYIDHDPVE